MTTTANNERYRLVTADTALRAAFIGTNVESEIVSHPDGTTLLRLVNNSEMWNGTDLSKVAEYCNALDLIWWVSDIHFFNDEWQNNKRVALSIATKKY